MSRPASGSGAAGGNPRAKMLGDRIREIVAELLERRVKDPRLGMVTVTDAKLTGDLREASVFYTVYGDEKARSDTAAALASAKGMIRTEVGKRLGLKHTPSVEFHLDAVEENAGHIEELLAKARESDAELSRQASGKTYAGEADPYRKPRPDEADDDGTDVDGVEEGEPDQAAESLQAEIDETSAVD